MSDIDAWSVDVFVMGDDWEGEFDYLSEFCEVIYLERTDGVSSTMIKKMMVDGRGARLPYE
ncbi:Glycerol-3-phosphate cytidylyltransferase [compost metagenome]